jgi:hypothetical protein
VDGSRASWIIGAWSFRCRNWRWYVAAAQSVGWHRAKLPRHLARPLPLLQPLLDLSLRNYADRSAAISSDPPVSAAVPISDIHEDRPALSHPRSAAFAIFQFFFPWTWNDLLVASLLYPAAGELSKIMRRLLGSLT